MDETKLDILDAKQIKFEQKVFGPQHISFSKIHKYSDQELKQNWQQKRLYNVLYRHKNDSLSWTSVKVKRLAPLLTPWKCSANTSTGSVFDSEIMRRTDWQYPSSKPFSISLECWDPLLLMSNISLIWSEDVWFVFKRNGQKCIFLSAASDHAYDTSGTYALCFCF